MAAATAAIWMVRAREASLHLDPATPLLAANPCLTVPAQGRIPHITLKCVRTLRDKLPNAQVSVEVEKPGRDGLRELAAEANVVFYSKSWAEVCDTPPQRKPGKVLLGGFLSLPPALTC